MVSPGRPVRSSEQDELDLLCVSALLTVEILASCKDSASPCSQDRQRLGAVRRPVETTEPQSHREHRVEISIHHRFSKSGSSPAMSSRFSSFLCALCGSVVNQRIAVSRDTSGDFRTASIPPSDLVAATPGQSRHRAINPRSPATKRLARRSIVDGRCKFRL